MTSAVGMRPVLECRDITKRYGDHLVFADVSFAIMQGERVALLGPNGAGKSTLVDLILGLSTPSAGSVRLSGTRVDEQPVVRAMLQEVGYIDHLTGSDMLAYEIARTGSGPVGALEGIVAQLSMAGAMSRKIKNLSGGEKRKLDLILALAGQADLLILDEPTTGMDLEGRKAAVELIRRRTKERGQALLLTTHLLEEADALAERVLVLADHQLKVDRSVADGIRTRSIFLDTLDSRTVDRVRELADTVTMQPDGIYAQLPASRFAELADLLRDCAGRGMVLEGLRITPESLHDVYREAVRR